MQSIIIVLILMFISPLSMAGMYVKPSIACLDGTKYYANKAACEAAEGATCQDFNTWPLTCRDQEVTDRSTRNTARAARRQRIKDGITNWDTLTNAQKFNLLRDLLRRAND